MGEAREPLGANNDIGANQALMLNAVTAYIGPGLEDPVRKARATEGMRRTLFRHLSLSNDSEPLPDILSSSLEDDQYEVIAGYLALVTIRQSFSECQYYFRRYPFNGLPVKRSDHLRNCCEMYFDRMVQFKDRLKRFVNAIKKVSGKPDLRFSALIVAFNTAFDWELRHRNAIHHQKRFEYDAIAQISLIELLSLSSLVDDLPAIRSVYSQESRLWVRRVKERDSSLQLLVEAAAGLALEKCAFLVVKPAAAR